MMIDIVFMHSITQGVMRRNINNIKGVNSEKTGRNSKDKDEFLWFYELIAPSLVDYFDKTKLIIFIWDGKLVGTDFYFFPAPE